MLADQFVERNFLLVHDNVVQALPHLEVGSLLLSPMNRMCLEDLSNLLQRDMVLDVKSGHEFLEVILINHPGLLI